MWHLYVVRCSDGSLYAGITTDVERRLRAHNEGRAAKYTRVRWPVTLVGSWTYPDRSSATRAEHAFKRLRRPKKLRYVRHPEEWAGRLS